MQTNTKTPSIYTAEGGKVKHINPELQLRRSVMCCLLNERTFYEEGKNVLERIKELVPLVEPKMVVSLAIEAREEMHLRHVPLLLVRELARHKASRRYVSRTLQRIIKRADEITEFLALYWSEGKIPLANKVKQGLNYAFQKFNEYQFGKYDRDAKVKLRDALFLCHGKPKDLEKNAPKWTKVERKGLIEMKETGLTVKRISETDGEKLYKAIVDRTLTIPDTWEVALSSGVDKKETFERLMVEKKLGALAFLRNLRNMHEATIERSKIEEAANNINFSQILPFQFIAAAVTNPQWESTIERLMLSNLITHEKLTGKTVILVDVSGSMDSALSSKSQMRRFDAACGVAIICREICQDARIATFSTALVHIADRRGFALRDAIIGSQPHGGTYLGEALKTLHTTYLNDYDRLIIITDEQSSDRIPDPKGKGYVVNISAEKNGVGYGAYTHIDGFSESIIKWMMVYEKAAQGELEC